MNVATVLESSLPVSMMRRHKGMISVDRRKLITSESSIFVNEVSLGVIASSDRRKVATYLHQGSDNT